MLLDARIPAVGVREGGVLRFRFSPRDAKVWRYVLRSDVAELDGVAGSVTAVPPPRERTARPAQEHPRWWTDDPDPEVAEGVHAGAKSVSRWREAFLAEFALRLRPCDGTRR